MTERGVSGPAERPLFTSVQIETMGLCNRKCVYCPNSVHVRRAGLMDRAIYMTILNELHRLRFHGRICLHGYGEPLLDPQIVRWVRHARVACPHAHIGFSSNGDFLTAGLLESLIDAGLEHMLITQSEAQQRQRILAVVDDVGELARRCVVVRSAPRFSMNRAGLVLGESPPGGGYAGYCPRPFEQVVVDWSGRVLLCCCDYTSREVMGHVRLEDLASIWRGRRFEVVRAALSVGDRSDLVLCRRCNYPSIRRATTPETGTLTIGEPKLGGCEK